MNFEVIKTYILTFLVVISLLLTLALWNYRPNYEPLYSSEFVNEVDLGGEEVLKRSLIMPSTIALLKNNDEYYGFNSPVEEEIFYQDMQEWLLSDFRVSPAVERPKNNYQVEIVFPNMLPAEIIKSIFHINEEDLLPNWSFQRMFILLNEETSSLELLLLSIDGQQQLKYNVNKSDAFTTLLSYFENPDNLTEYSQFGSPSSPIYIPKESIQKRSHSLAIRSIDETLLIGDLLNPSSISTNLGGSYFTDGQRRLSILQGGRTMEFINPIHATERLTDAVELLDLSINHINEHKGWTDDYRLVDIDVEEEILRYRMFHEGTPIFSNSDLSMIEQEWRNRDLHLYRRPLYSISSLPGSRAIELPSGTKIANFLLITDSYQVENIEDIQIGYKITNFDDASYSLRLDPAWYVKHNGFWSEIRVDELDELMGRGS